MKLTQVAHALVEADQPHPVGRPKLAPDAVHGPVERVEQFASQAAADVDDERDVDGHRFPREIRNRLHDAVVADLEIPGGQIVHGPAALLHGDVDGNRVGHRAEHGLLLLRAWWRRGEPRREHHGGEGNGQRAAH